MSMDYAEDKLGPKNSEDYIRFLEAELEAAKHETHALAEGIKKTKGCQYKATDESMLPVAYMYQTSYGNKLLSFRPIGNDEHYEYSHVMPLYPRRTKPAKQYEIEGTYKHPHNTFEDGWKAAERFHKIKWIGQP